MSLPNIVFLDFDGVICTPRASFAMGDDGIASYLDPVACMLVKKLCLENNARLVISSAWRLEYAKASIAAILSAACPGLGGLVWDDAEWWRTRGRVYSNDENTSDRGREIQEWIKANATRFNNFVVLDDMADMRPLQDNLVKCDVYEGMGMHSISRLKRC